MESKIDVVLVLVCVVLLRVRQCEALDLQDKQAEQSTTNSNYFASKAIDGDPNTPSVTLFENQPWWRVDLGDIYCLKKITLQVRLSCCATRLQQARVKAGFSSDHSLNRMIGSPISVNESQTGALLPFVPSPLVTARYVSVSNDQHYNVIVSMAEVMVDELLDTDMEAEITEEGVDFTLVIYPPVVGQGDIFIGAYKGCRDITANVSFGRQLTTDGGNQNGLPAGSSEADDIYYGRATRLLLLPDLDGDDRVGVFYSEASKNETTTRIQTIILPKNDTNVHIVPVHRTVTTNIGESVTLQMINKNSPTSDFRWKHNEDAIGGWNNQLNVSIPSVVQSDEGIYSCFLDGQEHQQRHGITRLIVRGCTAGMWGPPSCSLFCSTCYNGGVCDDITGTCICAPGFSGENCEQGHGRHVFGKNAERSCSNSTDPHHTACQGRLFCLRDPYGCSCAAGYMGLDCMQECEEGTYGADCKQTCKCADGQTCLNDTGQCSGDGCASPYFGSNCLCSRESSVAGLEVTADGPYQLSATWQPDNCFTSGFFIKLTEIGSVPSLVVEQQINNTEEYVIVDGLVPFTEYLLQVGANTSEGHGPYGDGVTVKTAEAEPTAPLNVTITKAYRSAMIVEWVTPNTPNGIIINYDITFWRADSSSSATVLTDVQPGNELIYQIINLSINSTNSIQVRAKTSVGAGPWSDVINGTTQSGAFEFVTNLRLMNRTDTSVTLQWDLPSNIQGHVRRYIVEYKATEKPHQPSFTTTEEYLRTEVEVLPYRLDSLEPGTKYEIRVSLSDEESTEGAAVLEVFTRPQYDPPEPLPPISYPDESTLTTVTISLNTASFDDAYIVSYVVHVKKTTSSSAKKREALLPLHYANSPYDYIAAEFLKQSATERFVVGDGETYGGYYNAPLERDTDYEIRVGAVSKGNGTEAFVTFSAPVSVTVSEVQGVESCEGGGGTNSTLIASVIVLGIGVFILGLGLSVVSMKYMRNRNHSSVNMMADGQVASHFLRKVESSSDEVQPYDDVNPWTAKCDITWSDLTIDGDSLVGKGCFTEVRMGSVKIEGKITQAAIKTLKADVPRNAIDDLVGEFLTMRTIGPHPNIVAMLGACFHDDAFYLATEFLSKGNLRQFLRNNRLVQLKPRQSKSEDEHALTSSNLLQLGVDVAEGMEHLSECRIFHQNLCARNVLLGSDMTAKISDLGIPNGNSSARECSGRRVATRWMATESLTLKIHLCKSDVWSFGILLWEIVTFGGTPYPDLESRHLAGQLMSGYRMPKPENCVDELYDVMLRCWQLEPNDRPCFKDISKNLLQINVASETHTKSPPISSPTIYENFSVIDPELDDR